MAARSCKFCDGPLEGRHEVDGVCMECVVRTGSALRRAKPLTKDQLKILRDAIEHETGGLFPPATLRAIIEAALDRAADGDPRETVVEELACEIQRMGGLGMCREMLKVSDALSEVAQGQEDEIRDRVRRLSKLGRE